MSDKTTSAQEPPASDRSAVPPAQSDGVRGGKPLYKRWWFWAVAAVVLFAAIGILGDEEAEEVVEPIIAEMEVSTEPAPEPEDDSLAANEVRISRDDYGDAWPFTVEEGVLACVDLKHTFTADGTTYALNGMAIQAGYPEIDEIWLDDPAIPGAKVSISPFNSLASELCE